MVVILIFYPVMAVLSPSQVVTQAAWADVVGEIARVHRSLPELCDAEGRRAYDQAVQVTRAAIDDAVLFCGRFKLGEKLHQVGFRNVTTKSFISRHYLNLSNKILIEEE